MKASALRVSYHTLQVCGLEIVVGSAVLPSDLEEFTFPQQGPSLYLCSPG